MIIRSPLIFACLIVSPVTTAAQPSAPSSFEEMVQTSDRIIVGRVQGTNAGSVRLPNGGELSLGIKDPATGLVFTPYRVRVVTCLFDKNDSCRLEDMEIVLPGGTVYETVDGEPRLRTWEVAAAAAPLSPDGEDVLLFMTKRSDRYMPLGGSAARVRVDRSARTASVVLQFASPRFLSAEGRESARARVAAANPATTCPVFIESVPLDRLKELISLARQVPKPTSGTRHAIPDRTDACASDAVRERSVRLRAREVSQRLESSLGLGGYLDSIHRPDDRRRTFGT
jgi:hypothetical protein